MYMALALLYQSWITMAQSPNRIHMRYGISLIGQIALNNQKLSVTFYLLAKMLNPDIKHISVHNLPVIRQPFIYSIVTSD